MSGAMSDMEPEIFVFEGQKEGPSFSVLGGVHGNEPCGSEAIDRILRAVEAGQIQITCGTLTCIPVCNPRARKQGVRFVERNLNRFMYPKEKPEFYEDYLDNILCPVLEKSDYVLDLHSYTSPGEAFLFLENRDEENSSFAEGLGVPRAIYGWADALQDSEDVADKRQAMGTTEYAREHGAVSITLECGTHDHPRAVDVGFQAILNALLFLNIANIDKALHIHDLPDSGHYTIKMEGAYLKTKEGDFTQDWKNLDFVSKDTVVARYDDGDEIIMPMDAFIVLPKRNTVLGHEWFFYGTEEPS